MVQNAGEMPENGQKKNHTRQEIAPNYLLIAPYFR